MWSDPEVETVLPGVHRLPLPLPGNALAAINVYALEHPGGVTLVDSGWHGTPSLQALVAGLAQVGLHLDDLREVLVTHVHGDHVGQTAHLRAAHDVPFALGRDERVALSVARGGAVAFDADRDAYLQRLGADELLEELRAADPLHGVPWENPDRWLEDGDRLELPGGVLHAIATPGHTRGHVSFHDAARGVFLAGDHVLPHITPSIGFEPSPTPTALADYLASLARVRSLPAALVLPAHGPVFDDLAGRVDELLAHHDRRLTHTEELLGVTARSPYEVAQGLRWRRREMPFEQLGVSDRMLATWEAAAHLEVLVAQGRAHRERGRYLAVGGGPSPDGVVDPLPSPVTGGGP